MLLVGGGNCFQAKVYVPQCLTFAKPKTWQERMNASEGVVGELVKHSHPMMQCLE